MKPGQPVLVGAFRHRVGKGSRGFVEPVETNDVITVLGILAITEVMVPRGNRKFFLVSRGHESDEKRSAPADQRAGKSE